MTLAVLIELLVAVLLVTTIGYSVVLNRRLGRLQKDEGALRQTIAELVTATDTAERAIAELRAAAADAERALAARLGDAQATRAALSQEVAEGAAVLKRVVQLVEGTRSGGAPVAAPAPQREVVVQESLRERAPFHRARGAAA